MDLQCQSLGKSRIEVEGLQSVTTGFENELEEVGQLSMIQSGGWFGAIMFTCLSRVYVKRHDDRPSLLARAEERGLMIMTILRESKRSVTSHGRKCPTSSGSELRIQ